jgi:hypothetical protein
MSEGEFGRSASDTSLAPASEVGQMLRDAVAKFIERDTDAINDLKDSSGFRHISIEERMVFDAERLKDLASLTLWCLSRIADAIEKQPTKDASNASGTK